MRVDREWLLALDISGPRGVLALEGPRGLFYREVAGGSRVSQLFVTAGEVFSEAGIDPRHLGLIGVARGPGSFTGVRVGVMAAKVLAAVFELPLVAPDSLRVMAMGARGEAEAVFVALDARRGEVYHALYGLDGEYPVGLEGPRVAPPAQAARSLSRWRARLPGRLVLAGSGIDAFPDAWPADLPRLAGELPEPGGLAQLCRYAFERGEDVQPMQLLPLYLRRPDAREHSEGGKEGRG